MQQVPGLFELRRLQIPDLDKAKTPEGEITGVVTLLWPYSASALKLTALVAEPDHRKRDQRGNLKVSFYGYAAENLRDLTIGNVVKLSLEGASWTALPNAGESDVPWHLSWEKRLRVKVFKDSTATEPYLNLDETFSKARLSGVFERIAAAESIINESQSEDGDNIPVVHTPPRSNSRLSGSWSTPFFSSTAVPAQGTPFGIFSQSRRRLYGSDSDEEGDTIEGERLSKKPRLFESSQSFRYVADSPPEGDDSEILEPIELDRSEIYDENSIDATFKTAREPGSRLSIRRDESENETRKSQPLRATLQEKSQKSSFFVLPDDDTLTGLKSRGDSKPFPTILSQRPETPTPIGAPSQSERDKDAALASLSTPQLPGSRSETPTRIPLAPKADPARELAPESASRPSPSSLPVPPPLEAIEVESQAMSSFTLESEPFPASRPSNIEMPPPILSAVMPLLETHSQSFSEPITPDLRPTASPVLPIPSPFPNSALERTGFSFLPSQLSQDITSSITQEDTSKMKQEEVVLTHDRTTPPILQAREASYVEETIVTMEKETVTVVEQTPLSFLSETLAPEMAVERESPATQPVIHSAVKPPEVISLLDSSDEENSDEQEEDEYEEQDREGRYPEEYSVEENEYYEEDAEGDDDDPGEEYIEQDSEDDVVEILEDGEELEVIEVEDESWDSDESDEEGRRVKNQIEFGEMEGEISENKAKS
ncbi:hypothetical protein ABW19_dt0203777 [Dactylella cylindrospora]|nr:hypothetical protein ABW19_dt0203777 [Dactylella cylindrospora]